jgi:hypothetical protein
MLWLREMQGTIRDREKVMRGLQCKESTYYNYCRMHSKLKKVPAEQAGLQLDLQGDKVESLVRLASSK